MAADKRGPVRGPQEVKLRVGKLMEMSGMNAQTYEQVRNLIDAHGYSLVGLLEAGIAGAAADVERSLANGPCACGNPMSECRDCNDGGGT